MTTETGETIRIDILGPGNRPLVAELRILNDTVEVWVDDDQHAEFARTVLAGWLTEPEMPKPLQSAGVNLSVDLEQRLVIYLPAVPTWVRAPEAEQQLREALCCD